MITGFWSSGTTRVTFDGLPGSYVYTSGGNYISCYVPAHAAGAVDVTVINPDGSSTTLPGGYTYGNPPTADFTASPTSGQPPLTVQFTDTSDPGSGRAW